MSEELTQEVALRAYARMLNTGDLQHIEPLLADDFKYASQTVLSEMTSKEEFLRYMAEKLENLDGSDSRVFAEMAHWSSYGGGPCVVLAQGDPESLVCTVVADVRGEKVSRIDLCVTPPPETATRTSEYPT